MVTTTRLELPDGDYAELRDPKKVPERLRRPVRVAAINLQRSLPEDQRRGSVKTEDPEKVAGEDVQSAFGVPPVSDLVEVNEPELTFLPDEEQQAFVDSYNEALIRSVVVEWSFGEVTTEVIQDLPGDAFDALITHIRNLGVEDESDESLASDPSTP